MRNLEDAIERFLAGGPGAPDAAAGLPADDPVSDLLRPMLREESPAADAPARTMVGDLHLLRELGRGGMGVVYEADDPRLRRRVAVKLLRRDGTMEPSAIVRFRREAELAASLRHPAIVPIHGVGETDSALYLVMELQRAAPLSAVIAALRDLLPAGAGVETLPPGALRTAAAAAAARLFPPERGRAAGTGSSSTAAPAEPAPPEPHPIAAARVLADIADALGHAHAHGIVHRDVKPSNILLSPDGRAHLSDFGLARDLAAPTVTRTGDAPGTPQYMAPEQARGDASSVGPATDVYALGATLYELLTLQRAFAGGATAEVLMAVLRDEPTDLGRLNRAVPADLRAIVQKAMQKIAAWRYADGAALAQDLRAFLRGEPVTARPTTRLQRLRRWAAREPWRALAAGLLVVLVPIAATFAIRNARHEDQVALGERVQRAERIDRLLADGFREASEGDLATARRVFGELLEFQPGCEEGVAGLSVVARRAGVERALQALRDHPQSLALSGALRRREAALLRDLGRDEEAAKAAAGLDEKPVGFDAFLDGYRSVERGHRGEPAAFAEAARLLHRAIVTTDHPPRVFHYEWLHAAAHARDETAVDAATASVRKLWPDDAATWFWLAFASDQAGDVPAAIAALQHALACDPGFVNATANLARLLRRSGRAAESLEVAARALKDAPASPNLHLEQAQSHHALGQFAEAVAHFRRALELAPNDVEARRGLAGALIDGGNDTEGGEIARDLIAQDPNDAVAHFLVAAVHLHAGQRAAAREHLQRHTELQPNARGFYSLGMVCGQLGDVAAAKTAYEAAIARDPRHAEALTNLANIVVRGGDLATAEALLRRAVAAAPDLVNARRSLMAALKNQPAALVASVRDWVAQQPALPEAWRWLGWQLLQTAGSERAILDEAMTAVRKAQSLLGKDDGPTLHVLGSVQLALGDVEAARATLGTALNALPPGDQFTPYYQDRIREALQQCDARARQGGGDGRR